MHSSFWNTDITKKGSSRWHLASQSHKTANGKAMGKSTADLKKQSTYTTDINDSNKRWDFNNVWKIDPSKNNGYPYLKWQDN